MTTFEVSKEIIKKLSIMANIDPKAVNRAAIHHSQLGTMYRKFGEAALALSTPTQNLLRQGFTPFHGRKDVLKELGVRQILAASPGMRDMYTFHYEPENGTGYIGRISEAAQGLNAFVDLLEAKNNYKTHVYCDTSITGNCLFFAFYNRPQNGA